jgi:hypothetical protein
MYGLEKIEVVNPINAVNVTRKTLRESIKNCLSRANTEP